MIARAEAFASRLGDWWKAFLVRLKERNRLAWLAVVGVAMVATAIVSDRFAQAVSVVPTYIGKYTVVVLRAPLWQGGIVLLAFLALMAFWAFLDAMPTRKGTPRLGHADVLEMERAKELWTDEAIGASAKLGELLSRAVEHFENDGNTFARLLWSRITTLSNASGLVADILSQKKAASFNEQRWPDGLRQVTPLG